MKEMDQYLKPTQIIDCDTGMIHKKARQVTKGQENVIEKAQSLFRFARDEIN